MMLLSRKEIKQISESKKVRLGVVEYSFYHFFIIYFNDHIKYSLADFHKEIIELAEDDNINLLNIISFRGSGKSTILNTAYIIWSILCRPNKKFVLLLGKTQNQSKVFLENIKIELETNELLIKDFGLLKFNLTIKKTEIGFEKLNSVINIGSTKTSLRGMKKGKTRPDLVICDDLEDVESVGNTLTRNRVYNWFKQEVIPLTGDGSKIILLGNYLHKESLLNKLNIEIENNTLKGVTKKYPIIENDNILWKGKFNYEDIESLKKSIGDSKTWRSEYLLVDGSFGLGDIEVNIVTRDKFGNLVYKKNNLFNEKVIEK